MAPAARFYIFTMDKATHIMFNILAQHVEGGRTRMTYDHVLNVVRYEWEVGPNAHGNGGYTERGACHLNDWFTDDEQMHVLDMIMPAL